MVVIENAQLIERRLKALRQRRHAVAADHHAALPSWAGEALVAAGMTRAEIDAFNAEPRVTNQDAEEERVTLDALIEELENQLLEREAETLSSVRALAEIAVTRLKRSVAADPADLFYDEGSANTILLLERVVDALGRLDVEPLRHAG